MRRSEYEPINPDGFPTEKEPPTPALRVVAIVAVLLAVGVAEAREWNRAVSRPTRGDVDVTQIVEFEPETDSVCSDRKECEEAVKKACAGFDCTSHMPVSISHNGNTGFGSCKAKCSGCRFGEKVEVKANCSPQRGSGIDDGPDPIGWCLRVGADGACQVYGQIIVDDPDPTGIIEAGIILDDGDPLGRGGIIVDDGTPWARRNPCTDLDACADLIDAVCSAAGYGGLGVGVDVSEPGVCQGPCASGNMWVKFRCQQPTM